MMKKLFPVLTVIIFIFFGCKNNKAETILKEQEARSEIEESNMDLVKKLLMEGDNKNVAFLDEICAPDYKYYFPSNNTPLNLKEHKQFWKSVNQAFPDLTHEIKEIYAMDEIVVVRSIVRGIHVEAFAGIMPTNKTVEISQIFICRIENNRLVEFREEADVLGLYQQLGMELKGKE